MEIIGILTLGIDCPKLNCMAGVSQSTPPLPHFFGLLKELKGFQEAPNQSPILPGN